MHYQLNHSKSKFTTKLVMRMAQTNFFKEFVPENEPISTYLERMELIFHTHEVGVEKHVAMMFSTTGSKPYGVLRSLEVPKTLSIPRW